MPGILAHSAVSPTVRMLAESSLLLSTSLFSFNLKDFHYLWDLYACLLVETKKDLNKCLSVGNR